MKHKRVVITGMGITSCIGSNKQTVLESLKHSKSGISFSQEYKDLGLRSQISGSIPLDLDELIPRKIKRFMNDASCYAYLAMQQAITDSKLSPEQVSNPRTGLIIGSGGSSPDVIAAASETLLNRGVKKLGPYMVTKTMSSGTSACLATPFKIKGVNYSISSACATSAHCIGNAMEQIQFGKQDIMFAGGSEEESVKLSSYFDAMGALSTKYNDTPTKASRPYDTDRDGFVIAGGAGVLVLEELEHALNRGAHIYAEIVGYGATSDGYNMVAPGGGGAARCMQQALNSSENIKSIDYINTHGTSTPVGDTVEIEAIKEVFGNDIPPISSTKSISGHSLGAISAQEAIFSLLMMENNFIAPSINIENIDEQASDIPVVRSLQENVQLNTVMSNSFGFGGTNATLIFERFHQT
jgi:3-oxoacyl-[acyl-carrier-protein] synthase I